MFHSISILPFLLLVELSLWGYMIVSYYIKNKKIIFYRFPFTIEAYYLLMSFFIFALLIDCLYIKSFIPLLMFIIFSVLGILGESGFAIWWETFFRKRLWIYNKETIIHTHSSLLNFIPWGVGGVIYNGIAEHIISEDSVRELFKNTKFVIVFVLAIFLCIFLNLFIKFLLVKLTKTPLKFENMTVIRYIFVTMPFTIPIGLVTLIYSKDLVLITLAFAVVGTSVEYLFGKVCQFIISRKLWIYTYASLDDGHFSPLTIPMFCAGGYLFWVIGQFIYLYIIPYLHIK